MFDLLWLFIWITSFLQVQVIVRILLRSLEENIVIFNLVARSQNTLYVKIITLCLKT